jgi:hypothetical protein
MDLGDFLDHEVYPALFDRLDRAFPEYGFYRRGKHWQATADASRALPGSPRPDRVCCYERGRRVHIERSEIRKPACVDEDASNHGP